MVHIAARFIGITICSYLAMSNSDEALAIFMLKRLPHYKYAEIIRSRDAAVLDTCDMLVDVGSVYDPAALKFDHHQRGFMETFSDEFKTKLSSAGLIYK